MPDHAQTARPDADPPYSETLVMRQKLDTWKAEQPAASVMTGPFLEAAVRPLLDLIDSLAATPTGDEAGVRQHRDAALQHDRWIIAARSLSWARPDPSTVNTGDDSR